MIKSFRRISLISLGVLCYFGAHSGVAFAKDHSLAEEKIRALNKQIIAANEKNDLAGALQAAEKAVQVAKADYGAQGLKTAETLNNLANLYIYADRAPEAEQLFKRVILIELEKMDKEDTGLADTYFNLGVAYAAQKKYKAAVNILHKALDIRLKKLGPDDATTKRTDQMITELSRLAYPETEKI